ncbi:MAG: cyclomaltodextrinase C-terminal domain-containing protein [Muribaculaceae bacterium]
MSRNGICAYRRKLGDKDVIVRLNGRDVPNKVTMERTLEILPYGTTMTDIISGKPVTIAEEMTLEPRQVMILQNF